MAQKEIMRKHEFVAWIANTRKKEIDESCPCSRGTFLRSLRDDTSNHVISICSDIYNWKIKAEDDTGLTIEQMDENDDQQVAQLVVDKLLDIFATEINSLGD